LFIKIKTNLNFLKTFYLKRNQKILTTYEQTNVDNIYAIGDVMDETSANNRVLELTPVRRIFNFVYKSLFSK
jgi:thioredoxin reductase